MPLTEGHPYVGSGLPVGEHFDWLPHGAEDVGLPVSNQQVRGAGGAGRAPSAYLLAPPFVASDGGAQKGNCGRLDSVGLWRLSMPARVAGRLLATNWGDSGGTPEVKDG